MQQSFLGVALTNFSLFNCSSGSHHLLQSINQITGISTGELLHAERRILRTGSLAPLRELLSNPTIPRAERFRFKISLKQIHKGKATTKEQVASRFLLEISTARGQIDIEIMMLVKRKFIDLAMPRQSAQIQLNYTIHQGNQIRTHTQNLKIADRMPTWQEPQRAPDAHVSAFAA